MTSNTEIKEKSTRRIIRESTLHTSEEFTKKLMHRIELKNAVRRQFVLELASQDFGEAFLAVESSVYLPSIVILA